jgi:hypothetical protein
VHIVSSVTSVLQQCHATAMIVLSPRKSTAGHGADAHTQHMQTDVAVLIAVSGNVAVLIAVSSK